MCTSLQSPTESILNYIFVITQLYSRHIYKKPHYLIKSNERIVYILIAYVDEQCTYTHIGYDI